MRTPLFLLMILVAGCGQRGKDQSRHDADTAAQSATHISTEALAQRLAGECAFIPYFRFLERFTPQAKVPTMHAITRCQRLSASQRAARVILLTPITWDRNIEYAMLPLQGQPDTMCDKLAKAAEKDLLAIARACLKTYATWKDRQGQEELNRLEMQLNEQITKEKAKVVQAAEKFFRGGEDAGKKLEAAEQDLAQAFLKILKAHPDLEEELRTSLRAERAAMTKELQASRAKADSMLRTVDGQP
jgi:hypothetical protein